MIAVMMMVMMMVMMLYGLRMKKAVMKLRMNLFLLLIPTVWGQLFKLKVKPQFRRTFDITNVTRYCLLLLSPRPKPQARKIFERQNRNYFQSRLGQPALILNKA